MEQILIQIYVEIGLKNQ